MVGGGDSRCGLGAGCESALRERNRQGAMGARAERGMEVPRGDELEGESDYASVRDAASWNACATIALT